MPTLAEVAADLYALPPGEMIPARDARARELRADGDPEAAAQVKRLRKPSTAAWVVNHLARADPGRLDQVVELGGVLRSAQADLDGARLRELGGERRRLVVAVAAGARGLAAEASVTVSDAVLAQVEATLTAAMIDDDAGRAVRSGLLVGTLQATGLGRADVASAVAAPEALGIAPVDDGAPVRHLHAVPDSPASGGHRGRATSGRTSEAERELIRERARRDVADAADDRATAELEHAEASHDVARIEAAAGRLDAERDAVRRRLTTLDDEARTVEAELRDAALRRERTERVRAEAARRHDEAGARLAALEPGDG